MPMGTTMLLDLMQSSRRPLTINELHTLMPIVSLMQMRVMVNDLVDAQLIEKRHDQERHDDVYVAVV